jgi:prepilin-type N-terminal cleavage/methylation domain-containing protein
MTGTTSRRCPPAAGSGLGQGAAGFTLIEIIAALTLAAVLGAVLFQFMGTALIRSADPITTVRDAADVESVMEEITADYVDAINQATPDAALSTLKDVNIYPASVAMAYIEFDSAGNEVALDPADVSDTLKVTVQAQGHALTVLFTNARIRSDDPKVAY